MQSQTAALCARLRAQGVSEDTLQQIHRGGVCVVDGVCVSGYSQEEAAKHHRTELTLAETVRRKLEAGSDRIGLGHEYVVRLKKREPGQWSECDPDPQEATEGEISRQQWLLAAAQEGHAAYCQATGLPVAWSEGPQRQTEADGDGTRDRAQVKAMCLKLLRAIADLAREAVPVVGRGRIDVEALAITLDGRVLAMEAGAEDPRDGRQIGEQDEDTSWLPKRLAERGAITLPEGDHDDGFGEEEGDQADDLTLDLTSLVGQLMAAGLVALPAPSAEFVYAIAVSGSGRILVALTAHDETPRQVVAAGSFDAAARESVRGS